MQHECAVVEHYFIRQRPLFVIEFQQTLPPPVPSLCPALSFIPFPCPSPLRRPRSEGGRVPAFASASPAAGERGGFPVITAEFTLDQTFHGNRSPRGGGKLPFAHLNGEWNFLLECRRPHGSTHLLGHNGNGLM